MRIAPHAQMVLDALERAGFAGHVVGGCVRDSLLGHAPHDWDVATNARPAQLLECFPGLRVLPTGLRHGTVTVLTADGPVEVTSYRVDGAYSDGRRPDSVTFTDSLQQDLARRDFTVNAMAYSPRSGLYDPFGGQADLHARRIVCVGDPQARFLEDALRILRAARFASTLGFSIEQRTLEKMLHNCERLRLVAAERIFAELVRMLAGQGVRPVLQCCAPVLVQIVPELAPCTTFVHEEAGPPRSLWEHTATAVHLVPPEPVLRLAMLLHDIAKPACMFRDTAGVVRFDGHEQSGARMAEQILNRLRCDTATKREVCRLVAHHGALLLPQRGLLLRSLSQWGERTVRNLLALQKADWLAQAPGQFVQRRVKQLEAAQTLLDELLREGACYSLRGLAIGGQDLLALGFAQDSRLGRTLHALLERVMDGRLPNRKEALLEAAREFL